MSGLIVVAGPPCSGKSTYVELRAEEGDVVLDLDTLAHALGYPLPHIDHADTAMHPAVRAAMTARASVIKHRAALPGAVTVWVIDTDASRRLALMATQVIVLDPGRAACHDRALAASRTASTYAEIDAWYASHPDRSNP